MASLSFLKDFKKNIAKIGTVGVGIRTVDEWLSTGNYALNFALSGNFERGIPLSKLNGFMGPSGSGKSFLAGNVALWAQNAGYHIVYLDSEHAIDIEYLSKIGVDVDEEKLTYASVTTIEDVNAVLSEFFTDYTKAYGRDNYDDKVPRVLIILDSLAMLSSSTEMDNYNKGVVKGDQGQLAKRRKAMLRMALGQIGRLPATLLLTDHVYPQDIMLGDGPWAITNSTRFSLSIIAIINKLKLKEDGVVTGVRMRVETYKSRFAKIGTKVELEVPYSRGMSPFSGLVDLLESLDVIAKGTAAGEKQKWVSIVDGEKIAFKENELTHEIAKKLFKHPKATPTREAVDAPWVDGEPEDDEE